MKFNMKYSCIFESNMCGINFNFTRALCKHDCYDYIFIYKNALIFLFTGYDAHIYSACDCKDPT